MRHPPLLLRAPCRDLTSQRILIDLLARNLVLLRQVLRCDRHAAADIAIDQRLPQAVLQLRRLAQLIPCPRPAQDMRRLRHILRPARQRYLSLAQLQQLRRAYNGLQPGAAQPVDCESGSLNR